MPTKTATPANPVVYLPSHNLLEADYNPRLLTDKQAYHLTESLLLFGLVDPLIVNQHPSRNHIIVGGHQRRRIATRIYQEGVAPGYFIDLHGNQRTYPAGHPLEGQDMVHPTGYVVPGCQAHPGGMLVPCWPVVLELAQEKELNIRLNLNTGEWNKEVLANNFDTTELLQFGFEPFQLGMGAGFEEPKPEKIKEAAEDNGPDPTIPEVTKWKPSIRLEFNSPTDLQEAQPELIEVLDRLLGLDSYSIQINLGSEAGTGVAEGEAI